MDILKRPPPLSIPDDSDDEPLEKRAKEDKHITRRYLTVKCVYQEDDFVRLECQHTPEFHSRPQTVILKDMWSYSQVKEGNIISVLANSHTAELVEVGHLEGQVIVEPFYLISPTTLTSVMFCERKAMLQERFRGPGTNRVMLLGSLVHEMFQTALSKSLTRPTTEELMTLAKSTFFHSYAVDLVSLGERLKGFLTDLEPYAANCSSWLRLYAPKPVGFSKPLDKELNRMSEIAGLETYIVDQVLGLKGKIDVDFKVMNRELRFPLELKTGKSSKSIEHQTQVYLYVLMLQFMTNDRKIVPGWILYLKDLAMHKVVPTQMDLNGVLHMRNTLASKLSELEIESFPPICKSVAFCEKCDQNLNCAIVQAVSEGRSRVPPDSASLMSKMVAHLTEQETEYTKRWLRWQFLEWNEQKNRVFKARLAGEEADLGFFLYALAMQNVTSLMENNDHWYDRVSNVSSWFSQRLRNLLIALHSPVFSPSPQKVLRIVREYTKDLDGSQSKAVRKCLEAEHFVIIQGYPGSGKTTTICALIRTLVSLGKSVLVTAHTNSAVDNVLHKVAQSLPEENLLRIGSKKSVRSDCEGFCLDTKLKAVSETQATDDAKYDRIKDIVMKTPAVFATCLSCANQTIFSSRRFDYCIVDEASQVVENIAIRPLLCSDKFILVGDSKQLGPLVVNKMACAEGMDTSLMDRLMDAHGMEGEHSVVLDHQYRMNAKICNLSSKLFYESRLKCANSTIANRVIQALNLDQVKENVDSEVMARLLSTKLEDSVVFVDTYSKEYGEEYSARFSVGTKSRFNAGEARFVVSVCKVLVQSGMAPSDIGVVSPYRGQVDFIQKRLRSALLDQNPECSTIDSYQGRDKDVIILSLVDGGPEDRQQSPDLLSNPRRLNVALSRARVKLVLVGCKQTLLKSSLMADLISLIENNVRV